MLERWTLEKDLLKKGVLVSGCVHSHRKNAYDIRTEQWRKPIHACEYLLTSYLIDIRPSAPNKSPITAQIQLV